MQGSLAQLLSKHCGIVESVWLLQHRWGDVGGLYHNACAGARYVVIRGLTITGGAYQAVKIDNSSSDIALLDKHHV